MDWNPSLKSLHTGDQLDGVPRPALEARTRAEPLFRTLSLRHFPFASLGCFLSESSKWFSSYQVFGLNRDLPKNDAEVSSLTHSGLLIHGHISELIPHDWHISNLTLITFMAKTEIDSLAQITASFITCLVWTATHH